MASLAVSELEIGESKSERKTLSQNYFVAKSGAVNKGTDVQILEKIWIYLRSVSSLDLSEVEIDVCEGNVAVYGTFENEQTQGRILHGIMNIRGVFQVDNRTHVLLKHPVKDFNDGPEIF